MTKNELHLHHLANNFYSIPDAFLNLDVWQFVMIIDLKTFNISIDEYCRLWILENQSTIYQWW